jgi:hypothetical protein
LRGCAALLVGALVLAHSPEVRAEDSKAECIRAHEQAQTFRQSGRLGDARRALLACVQSECPELVRRDCGPWLGQLDAEQPTVVIAARDEAGNDTATVQVFVDDTLLTSQLDGHPLDVDPGPHTFRFVLPNGRAREREFLIRAGEKAREIGVTFAPSPGSIPPAPSAPFRVAAPPAPDAPASSNVVIGAIAGTVALAALSSAIYFTIKQASEADELHNECPEGCEPTPALRDQIGDATSSRVLEGVSFGVAGLATGVALYFLLARPLRIAPLRVGIPGRVALESSSHGATVRWGVTF